MANRSDTNSTDESGEDGASRSTRLTFLALIILVSLVTNVLLLCAVCQSRKVLQSVQNFAIVNMSAVCLLDCVFNMALVFGSLASGTWHFDETLCRCHLFAMNIVVVETVLLLTLLTVDRYLAVKLLHKYDFMLAPMSISLCVGYTWLQSLAFSIPFLTNSIATAFHQSLHACSVSNETPLAFTIASSVFCFLAPVIAVLVLYSLIFYFAYKHHRVLRTLVAQSHYTEQLTRESRLWQEMLAVRFVGVLCILWLILQAPYIVATHIKQYHFSTELDSVSDYPSGVDVAFIWMHFSYSASFPVATYLWRKELWQTTKECVICRRSNSVVDIESKAKQGSRTLTVKNNSCRLAAKMKEKDQKEGPLNILSFNVPVLFATSDGIHIETPHCDVSDSEFFYAKIPETARSTKKQLKGRRLDVGYPENDDLALPSDTSDYDSNTEVESQFPPSRAVSARQVNGIVDSRKSMSDVSFEEQQKGSAQSHFKNSATFSLTNGNDSGLDLSDTPGSSAGKQLQNLVERSQVGASKEEDGNESGICNTTELEYCEDCNGRSRHNTEHCSHTPKKKPPRLKPLEKSKRSKTKKIMRKENRDEECGVIFSTRPAARTQTLDESPKPGERPGKLLRIDGDQENSGNRTTIESKTPSGNGRGHKRTMTSDSQKSLMDSNSSSELCSMKAQSS